MKGPGRSFLISWILGVASCIHVVAPRAPIEEEDGAVRVPLVPREGGPVVDVRIQGKVIPLLLDLGGFDTIALSPEALKDLQVVWTGKTRIVNDALGNTFQSREYRLPDVTVGPWTWSELTGNEFHHRQQIPAALRNGYVGLGLLQRFTLIIDQPRRTLVLLKPGDPVPREYPVDWWIEVPMSVGGSGVQTAASLGRRDLRVVWDTGASHSLLKSGLADPAAVTRRGNHPVYNSPTFVLSGRDYGPLEFVLMDFREPPADVLLGQNFLETRPVLIDFSRRRLALPAP
jgi:hypothetical protein